MNLLTKKLEKNLSPLLNLHCDIIKRLQELCRHNSTPAQAFADVLKWCGESKNAEVRGDYEKLKNLSYKAR